MVKITYPAKPMAGEVLPLVTESGWPCTNPATRVDRASGQQSGYAYSVDVHDKPTEVAVCAVLVGPNGQTIFQRDVTVTKDVDPTRYLPPYVPPEVDEDAPPGDEPGTPCQETHASHGTENARGYVRQSDSSSDDTVICVGFRFPGGQRHVRVTLHDGP